VEKKKVGNTRANPVSGTKKRELSSEKRYPSATIEKQRK
jgi:hypothetical protein